MSAPLIEIRQLTKAYHIGLQTQQVLKGIDLKVERGELMSVMGQSGSGKSTLMSILGLLDRQDAGDYLFEGVNVKDFDSDTLASIRNREIGFVFQAFFLLPRMTAVENVALPLMYRGIDKDTMGEQAMAMLEKVSMAEWANHKPNEMSGGQQQRVAIARALIGKPSLVLADEPTGALDPRIGNEILDLFIETNEAEGATLIIITHDPEVAKRCRRQVNMVDGHLQEGQG